MEKVTKQLDKRADGGRKVEKEGVHESTKDEVRVKAKEGNKREESVHKCWSWGGDFK